MLGKKNATCLIFTMTCASHLRIPSENHPLARHLSALLTLLTLLLPSVPVVRAEATSIPTGSTNNTPEAAVTAASIRSCPEAARIVVQTVALLGAGLSTNTLSQETLNSEVATRIRKELSPLVSDKRMEDSQAVSEAVARATTSSIESKTRTLSVEGPSGSKVLAVYKKQGEIVRRGEKIATLLHNGREVPIVATADGIMQKINISKGGILGNHLPSSARRHSSGSMLIASIITYPVNR